MKKLMILILALFMLLISACISELELIVKNNTTSDAWVRLDNGRERYIRAQGSISFGISSVRVVNLSYHGSHILPGNIYVDMDVAALRHISLEPNCGALRLYNSSLSDLYALSFAESGTYHWSENLLEYHLRPAEYEDFSLPPGYYDLRIRDENNAYYYVTAKYITMDNTSTYTFSGL